MKSISISLLLSFISLSFISGCSEKESLTDVQVKTNMITHSWMGEEYFTITVSDSSFRGKDFVETFVFRKDGSYFYYKYTMSSLGWIGKWNLEDNGNRLRLVRDDTYSEEFPITYLSSTSFILGDTNSRGYNLVSKNN
jgi:hypothetical protein